MMSAPADRAFVRPEGRRWILAAAILASALGFIDGTVVAIAMPALRADLGATLDQATWIQNAYMVTLSALILTGGAFGDRFGLAKVFGLGIGLFIITSLICAVAPNASTLILARGAQGIGAALMVPGSLSLIARAYPRAERGRAIGIWAAASSMTTALGPIIGGLALSLGGDTMWRWIFAINLPLGLIAIWMLWANVQRDEGRPGEKIDLIGAGLATLGLGLMAWALTGAEGGVGSVWSLVFGAAGIAAIVAFLRYEASIPHAMLPLRLFMDRGFAATNLATFALYFGLTAILFFLPMLTIGAWGISEIEAAAALAPLSIAIFLFGSRFGRLGDQIGAGKLIALGSLVCAVAYTWLGFSVQSGRYWAGVLPPMMLGGIGMSMLVAPLSAAVMGLALDKETGAASGVNNAVSRIAGLFAVAAMATLAGSIYRAAGGEFSFGLPRESASHEAASIAAFSAVSWACAALAFLSAVIAATSIHYKPEKITPAASPDPAP